MKRNIKNIFSNKNFIVCTGLIVLSILFSILFAKFLPAMPVISDSLDYHTIAETIIETGVYPTISDQAILYPPLYPLFLALVYSITSIGSFTAVYIVQYILVGILAATVFLISKKFFGVRTWIAILGALLILIWPYLILYSKIVSSEAIYIPILIGFFAVFLKITKSSGWKPTVLAGVLFGLAILARPVALLLIPWIIVGGFLLQKFFKIPTEGFPFKKYLLVFLVGLATLLPWEIYVLVKYDRVIPIASNLSYVLQKANKTFAYLSPTAEVQKKTPSALLTAKLKNIYLFWNPGAGGYHGDILTKKYPVLGITITFYKIGFFILLALAFIYAIWFRKRTPVLLTILLVTYFWALHTVLFPFPRYMLPVVPFLIILATIAIQELITRYEHFKNSHLPTS